MSWAIRSPPLTKDSQNQSSWQIGKRFTCEVLVRKVVQQDKDDATVIGVDDTCPRVNHEFGSYGPSSATRLVEKRPLRTETAAGRDTPVCACGHSN